jgi:hypothetical protein
VTLRGIAGALGAVVLLAAAPPPRLDPVPAGAQTVLARRYVAALAARRYADAYALLDPAERAYFRNAGNFAGTFAADGFGITSYAFLGTRGNAAFRLYFVRETVRVRDPAHDVDGTSTVTVPYGVAGTGRAARIKDLGRPWRAFASAASASNDGLRVTVKKVSFYQHAIACVVTFANAGDGFLTLLPYGRSVLRDDAGHVYRPIRDTKTWNNTDRQLFLGVRLAANAQITGVLSFAAPRLDDAARRYTLTVAPNVRDGGDAPFALVVGDIGAPA